MSDTGVTPLTPIVLAAEEASAAKEGFVIRDLIALDEATNVLLGGHPDETISSRASRDAAKGYIVGEVVSKALDLFQKNHGPAAQAGDLERATEIIAIEESSVNIPKSS